MQHHFEVKDAIEHGVEAAVILYNIKYWLAKEMANLNKAKIHDGFVWTYNSAQAFTKLFPYFNSKKIYRILKKLEDDGVIISGNFNRSAYDRTKWYTTPEFKVGDGEVDSDKFISENEEIDFPYLENGNSQNGEPIPNINTNLETTDVSAIKKQKRSTKVALDDVLIPDYLDKESYLEYLEIRKSLGTKNTPRALTLLVNKLDEIEFNQQGDGQKALDAAILNSWKSVYPVSDTTVKPNRSKTSSNDFEAMFNEVQAELAQHNISGSSKHSGPSRGIVEGELVNDGLNDFFTRDV